MKQVDKVRGLKVTRMLYHLYLRKILGKRPADERTLLKAASYKGGGGYDVIRNLEDQGLIAKQGDGYMITNEGERRIGSMSLMIDLVFKSKIHYYFIFLGVYTMFLKFLYDIAPTLIDVPLTLTTISILFFVLGIALLLAGELLIRRA